ncbi:type I methionyl aminopeptidase [Levilactobacillus bambusae]|uniref:Methionine aminopeptidase n=1 Tax=Levilactobacillus bambusae TaxID=2024736 RepID=A0A2V1N049_9LACO|nr:type I methionyl aminopeptidase [Levilactobacillus bambusae]PWF99719.1 type I methionyl aminopeptidase [Levilactobacillus bambusae]
MITIKSNREIQKIAESGAVLAGALKEVQTLIKPGVSTWDIEMFVRTYIQSHGAVPADLGFDGYKFATTISVNDEVAHTIPRKRTLLKEGDVVKVDTTVNLNGFMSDACVSYGVGTVAPEIQRLMDVTKKATYLGIDQAVIGNRIGDIGAAIQQYAEVENHFGVVRDLIGHGIQPTMHEAPDVPAYGTAGRGLRLKEGMTITIEPMINIGTWEITDRYDQEDDWTDYVSADGSASAQYEHTIAITKDGPKILTSYDPEFDAKYLL